MVLFPPVQSRRGAERSDVRLLELGILPPLYYAYTVLFIRLFFMSLVGGFHVNGVKQTLYWRGGPGGGS